MNSDLFITCPLCTNAYEVKRQPCAACKGTGRLYIKLPLEIYLKPRIFIESIKYKVVITKNKAEFFKQCPGSPIQDSDKHAAVEEAQRIADEKED